MEEVNNLLNRLGELEEAPLIWINEKVYDMAQEIERLNNIINNPEDLTLCKMWADTKLKEKNEELMSLYTSERYVKEDYKSKVNKAIEYIEENIEGNYFKRYDDGIYRACNDLKEILRGEDNEF